MCCRCNIVDAFVVIHWTMANINILKINYALDIHTLRGHSQFSRKYRCMSKA